MTENDVIQQYAKQAVAWEKWVQVFDEMEGEFMDLPNWAQGILLKDISGAFRSRITVMQKANQKLVGDIHN
jgi:hypothetical protein